MICFVTSSCVVPPEKVEYKPEFRIIEVDGKPMACQSELDLVSLYIRLNQCKENEK